VFVDLFHTKKLRLALIYIAFLILVQFLQDTVLARFAIFGVKTLFVPAAVCAVGFHEGGLRGGLYGLLAGVLCDMTYAENTVLFTMLFPALGFASGLAADFMMNRSYLAYLVTAAVCLLVAGFVQMLRVVVLQPGALFYGLIIVLAQALVSMPIAAVLYFPVEQISSRFEA
jgi:rod shape-determining protein MreD